MCLASNKSRTIRLSAIARLRISAISVNVVVENQLFAGFDVALGKYAHAQFLPDDPFIDVAVRIAGVVAESPKVALFGSIDKLALAQGHEIEMLDALVIILNCSASECWLIDYFSDVLEDKIIWLQVSIYTEAVAFFLSLDHRDVGVLFALEALILAADATIAVAIDTFQFR